MSAARYDKKLWEEIGHVLRYDWNPIGVPNLPDDEYSSYVGGVYRLVMRGASEAEIVDHLYHTQSVNLGLSKSDRTCLLTIACKLRSLNPQA